MQPQAVSRLKVWDLRDGQGRAPALNADFNLGTDEIECSIFCPGCTRKRQRDQEKSDQGNIESEMKTTRYESREAHYDPLTAGISGKRNNRLATILTDRSQNSSLEGSGNSVHFDNTRPGSDAREALHYQAVHRRSLPFQ
jgi:hypothetical protein